MPTPDGQRVRVSTSAAEGSVQSCSGGGQAAHQSPRLPCPSGCVQPKGLLAWGGGLLLPVPPGQPSFTASQQCSVRGDTLGHPPLIPTQEDPLFLRPAALLSRGPGFCLGGEGLAAGFSAPWGVGQAHSISMQHRGPQGPPISATPGSFHRACTACEQAEVGPCTKAGSHRVCVGEASEPCF